MQIRITVVNRSNQTHKYLVFSAPLVCPQVDEVSTICLYSTTLAPFRRSGATANLHLRLPFEAGVREESPFGTVSARREVDLSNTDDGEIDQLLLSVDPLGLPQPTKARSLLTAAFRFVTPVYDDTRSYFLGGALKLAEGPAILPSFIVARPNQTLDIQPVARFFVQTGVARTGAVIDFSRFAGGAALCDATEGDSQFVVEHSSRGTWSVTSGPLRSGR